jgi:hypothetical protein
VKKCTGEEDIALTRHSADRVAGAGVSAGNVGDDNAASSQRLLSVCVSCAGVWGWSGGLASGGLPVHNGSAGCGRGGSGPDGRGGGDDAKQSEGSIRLVATVGGAGRTWLGAWVACAAADATCSLSSSSPRVTPGGAGPETTAASSISSPRDAVRDARLVEAVRYLGHVHPVRSICGHAIQPFVATCSHSGEVLIWRLATSGNIRLKTLAVAAEEYAAVAWSPPLDPDAALWDAALLWALSCPSPDPSGRGAQLHALAVAPTSSSWCAAKAREGMRPLATFEADLLQGDACTQEALLQVVAVDDRARAGAQPPPSAKDSEQTHIVIAAWGPRLHVWRARVGVDENGMHWVKEAASLAQHNMGQPAVALAAADHLDRSSGRGGQPAACPQEQCVVCGGGEWVEVLTVDFEGVQACRRLWLGAAVTLMDISLLSAKEMLVLVRGATGAAADSCSQQVRARPERAVAYVVERKSQETWRVESLLPFEGGAAARASRLVTGDGSTLVSVVDDARLLILAPQPWSWATSSLPANPDGGSVKCQAAAAGQGSGQTDSVASGARGLLDPEADAPRMFVRSWCAHVARFSSLLVAP